MVREARDRINNEIKNFSIPEKIAWFTQQTKEWEESRKLGRNLKKSKAA
ncbi:MAG: hypothetical protein OZSIB_3326 [Candidatus Ozemobacter sibiricus]|uniref:Uncharacterized protein n=1 Tax=Candidatus Ozemobacter sibiricus TaxID=2268124 RepID=A0A367ZF56_9BACT|nr:MAG: hypothetical protein OZSIB_3326 [Candidatus Ozemobacter sibiricus]